MKFTTPGVLRQVLSDKVFPNKQATKVKHLVCFAFRKSSRQELLERDEKGKKAKNPKKNPKKPAKEGKEGRHQKLRKLDYDALKLCGLSYMTVEIAK